MPEEIEKGGASLFRIVILLYTDLLIFWSHALIVSRLNTSSNLGMLLLSPSLAPFLIFDTED